MTIKFEKIQPGMTLWTTKRARMGHTTMRRTVAVDYYVKDVDTNLRIVTLIRNGREIRLVDRRVCRMRATNPTCDACGKVGGHLSICSSSKKRTADATPATSPR